MVECGRNAIFSMLEKKTTEPKRIMAPIIYGALDTGTNWKWEYVVRGGWVCECGAHGQLPTTSRKTDILYMLSTTPTKHVPLPPAFAKVAVYLLLTAARLSFVAQQPPLRCSFSRGKLQGSSNASTAVFSASLKPVTG